MKPRAWPAALRRSYRQNSHGLFKILPMFAGYFETRRWGQLSKCMCHSCPAFCLMHFNLHRMNLNPGKYVNYGWQYHFHPCFLGKISFFCVMPPSHPPCSTIGFYWLQWHLLVNTLCNGPFLHPYQITLRHSQLLHKNCTWKLKSVIHVILLTWVMKLILRATQMGHIWVSLHPTVLKQIDVQNSKNVTRTNSQHHCWLSSILLLPNSENSLWIS